jgi:hypothetical protein
VKLLSLVQGFSPLSQLLSQPAIICSGAHSEGQAAVGCHPFQMVQHGWNSDIPPCKEFFQGQALFRRLWMQGKRDPLHLDIIRLFESFNTPGNEVAPGSDIVGEYLQ